MIRVAGTTATARSIRLRIASYSWQEPCLILATFILFHTHINVLLALPLGCTPPLFPPSLSLRSLSASLLLFALLPVLSGGCSLLFTSGLFNSTAFCGERRAGEGLTGRAYIHAHESKTATAGEGMRLGGARDQRGGDEEDLSSDVCDRAAGEQAGAGSSSSSKRRR